MSALCNGFTTGGCAAAVEAAILLLVEDRTAEGVDLPLPDGQRRHLPGEYVLRTDEGVEATRPPLAKRLGTGRVAETDP